MTKKRKSRKVGLIGIRKNPDHVNTTSGRVKKHKGKTPGSRHNVEQKKPEKSTAATNKDPRLGSKKPVQLIKSMPANNIAKRKYATPAEELAALEADDRLATLLDKLDEGNAITKEEQHYVDTKMARHKVLCELMGIHDDDDEEDEIDEFAALDALKIDDYEK